MKTPARIATGLLTIYFFFPSISSAHEIGVEHGDTHFVQAERKRAGGKGGKGGGGKGGGPRIQKPKIEDTVRANIYADNWFVLYINGRIAAVDSIAFIPHNVISVDLLPEYPMTIAVMARDNADPETGMEYNSTNIGDGGFILKFADGTVTSAAWKAKNFFHGPTNGDKTNPMVKTEPIPDDWFAIDFDDSDWSNATEYTEEGIKPKQPFYENDFEGAKWIWSESLELDNTVIFRHRVESPPNGTALPPDWPRGHIVPSATDAPVVKDASLKLKSAHATLASPEIFYISTEAPVKETVSSGDWKNAPPTALAFRAFQKTDVSVRWDDQFAYIEANAFPDHKMMTGITAWNQQVPLPQDYSGENAWRLPLQPQPAENRVSAKESLFKGAIAVALNGVPIFNPIKQDGRTDTYLAGELDEFGGHAGRADDYHYHIAPWHLQEVVGDSAPIAFALDGYALFGTKEADGSAVDVESLDEFNGHQHGDGPYHYHASREYPYINGGFHGEVALRDGQVAVQPRAQGVRPYTQPLRGAKITGFERTSPENYSLAYKLDGRVHYIRVETQEDGGAKFEFLDPDGETQSETYTRRARGDREGRSRGGGEGKPRRKGKGERRDDRPPRN